MFQFHHTFHPCLVCKVVCIRFCFHSLVGLFIPFVYGFGILHHQVVFYGFGIRFGHEPVKGFTTAEDRSIETSIYKCIDISFELLVYHPEYADALFGRNQFGISL